MTKAYKLTAKDIEILKEVRKDIKTRIQRSVQVTGICIHLCVGERIVYTENMRKAVKIALGEHVFLESWLISNHPEFWNKLTRAYGYRQAMNNYRLAWVNRMIKTGEI